MEECAICLCEISEQQTFITSCNHTFHRQCIERWMSGHDSCPLCRAHLSHIEPSDIRFSDRVIVDIHFNQDAPGDRSRGIWDITAINQAWFMPQSWIDHYNHRPSTTETFVAYRLANLGLAFFRAQSVGGRPPRRLFYCRKCLSFVCSNYERLQLHTLSFH